MKLLSKYTKYLTFNQYVLQYKKNLAILYLIAFFGDLGAVSISVLSILYATKLGLSTLQVGLIGAAYGITYLFMPAILGRIGDKLERKTSLMLATALQIIFTAILVWVLILDFPQMIFISLFTLLLLFGVAYGFFWPTIEASISENTEFSAKIHHKAISLFCLSWSIGYGIGPFFAGIFIDYNLILAGIIILILYIFAFGSITIGLTKISEIKKVKSAKEKPLEGSKVQKNNNIRINKIIILLMLGSAAYSIISKVIIAYFPNYALLSQGLNWSASTIGLIMLFFGVGRTFFFLTARYFPNNFSAIIQSLAGMGLCLLILVFIQDLVLIAVIFFILGILVGRAYFVSLELLMKYEQERKGAKAGMFESLIGLGSATTPIIAGSLALFNLKLPFLFFSILAFTFAISFYIFHEKREEIS